jgi:mutator protein MutT
MKDKFAPSPPAVTVSVGILVHNGRVLVGRRPAGVRLAGLWEFPGGKLEPGEAPRDCLLRELREEIGLEVEITGALDVIVHADHDLTVTLHPFVCRLRGAGAQPVVQPLVNSELRWVTAGELEDYPFPRANAPLLASVHAFLVGSGERNCAGADDAEPDR